MQYEQALDITKLAAESGKLLLVRFFSGFGAYGKGVHPDQFKIDQCNECQDGESVCCDIWHIEKKDWVSMCKSCIQKIWPKDP